MPLQKILAHIKLLLLAFLFFLSISCKHTHPKNDKQTSGVTSIKPFSHNEIEFHINRDSLSYVFIDRQKYTFNPETGLIIKDSAKLAYHILNFNKNSTDQLIQKLHDLLNSSGTFFLSLNLEKIPENLKHELSLLGFEKIKSTGKTWYFAYSYEGFSVELTGNQNMEIILPAEYKFLRSTGEMKKQYKDPSRFIAHAGGMIDGIDYSNSLEALNHNYRKGFKYFELDINKTADGKYVAVHSWKDWDSVYGLKTGYIPTHREFIDKKVFNKFTPMDIQSINEWFKNHKDAVLITDKVNAPLEFGKQFLDKKRLMMEVFDLKAFDEAYENQITAMLNWDVFLEKSDEEILQIIQNHHIKYLTASRRQIAGNKNIFLKLKEKGIRIYLFHVNFDPHKDERYVFLHELDYAYGMYADKWNFTD